MRRSKLTRFGFECLENRSMLAGNVTVDLIANNLLITGDNAANAIVITDTGTNLVISGVQGGTIGGTGLQSNTGVSIVADVATIPKAPLDGDIFINLLNGRDELSIDGINKTAGDDIPSKLKINLGEGDDTMTFGVTAGNFLLGDMTIDLDEGIDTLTVDGLIAVPMNEGNLIVVGGFGVDTITVGANQPNAIEGDFIINTGTGDDVVAVDRTNVFSDFSIDTGGGADTVDLGRDDLQNFLASAVQVRADLVINTGLTGDTVRLDAVLVGNNILISTADGDDLVLLGDDPAAPASNNDQAGPSARGDIVITTGIDLDTVSLNYVTGANAALFNLDLGQSNDGNSIAIRNSSFSNDVAILGGINADTIDIDALNIITNLYIATGGGADSIDLQGTLVTQGLLTVNSGAGGDGVRIDNSVISRLVVYAEAGVNDVDITANLINDFFLDMGLEGGSANLSGVVTLRGFARGNGAVGTGNLFGSIQSEGFTLG